jgi:HEAT repeat protein
MPLFGRPNVSKMKDKRDVEGLIKALEFKRDVEVRREAIHALGAICDARAVEPLIKVLMDPDDTMRLAALNAMGNIRGERALEALIAQLADPNVVVRSQVVGILEELADQRAVEPLSVALLRDSSQYIREAAALALGHIGDTSAVESLITALKDSNRMVIEAAAGALDRLGWQPDHGEKGATYWIAKQEWNTCIEIGVPAVEPLITTLKDPDSHVRREAVTALGRIGDTGAVEPLIEMLKDPEENVRIDAAYALGRIGDARAVKPLITIFADPYSRQVGKEALVQLGAVAVEPLGAKLQQSNPFEPGCEAWGTYNYMRISVAEILGKIGDVRAVEPLLIAIRDLDRNSASDIVAALVQLGAPAVESLVAALNDFDEKVREAAVSALERLGWQPDRNETGATYWILRQEWDRCVEIGAAAIDPLIATLQDSTQEVRTSAAGALDRLGWQPDQSDTGATYWVARQKWDKCVEIGVPAIGPLVTTMDFEVSSLFDENARAAAADALCQIDPREVNRYLLSAACFRDTQRRLHRPLGARRRMASILKPAKLDWDDKTWSEKSKKLFGGED